MRRNAKLHGKCCEALSDVCKGCAKKDIERIKRRIRSLNSEAQDTYKTIRQAETQRDAIRDNIWGSGSLKNGSLDTGSLGEWINSVLGVLLLKGGKSEAAQKRISDLRKIQAGLRYTQRPADNLAALKGLRELAFKDKVIAQALRALFVLPNYYSSTERFTSDFFDWLFAKREVGRLQGLIKDIENRIEEAGKEIQDCKKKGCPITCETQ